MKNQEDEKSINHSEEGTKSNSEDNSIHSIYEASLTIFSLIGTMTMLFI
ncbi:hypothetical protein KM1_223990 [Entamoeba histolytica HM-3:IMSS]|uniref:Uncharacterized protein n=1 Tax=Entamoeba histolytica HM-3:IMSS TaxID=885315 RepID=M7W580_ENTHI|nr:hypothetical protein KM1_223990 [Entamoeba histolytica HM-3:IMSS]